MSGNIPSPPVPSFTPSFGLQSGVALQKMANQLFDVVAGITAQADGTKANATPLTGVANLVETSAGAADSVLLPKGYVGLEITVANFGGNTIQVFGSGSDTIDNVATATGVTQADNSVAKYKCMKYNPTTDVAAWYALQGA